MTALRHLLALALTVAVLFGGRASTLHVAEAEAAAVEPSQAQLTVLPDTVSRVGLVSDASRSDALAKLAGWTIPSSAVWTIAASAPGRERQLEQARPAAGVRIERERAPPTVA